jgi:DNA-binding transcriptional LysR family regulator
MKDITLRQLQCLAETVRTGSLAGAATTLHVTAPAVAAQLRLLEKSLGLTLIERGPGGQHPTEAGQLVADTAARVAAELSECSESLTDLRSARAGRVTLGAVSTAKYFAPRVLAAFQASHPQVTVALSIGNRREVLDLLERYQIDIAVMGRPPGRLEVDQEVIGEHPYVVVAAPGHVLHDVPGITMERLAEEVFLIREPGSGTRGHLESLFAAAERYPIIGMEISSNETIKQAVIAGLGVALISAHTIAAEVADGRLIVLDVVGLPIRRHWLLVRMSRRAFSPAARELWRFFEDELSDLLPS